MISKVNMSREQFLVLLALWIETEAVDRDAEPYRNAGDRLVDDALKLID